MPRVDCKGCTYHWWNWEEVAIHLRRHHDLDADCAERLAREWEQEALYAKALSNSKVDPT